MNRKTFLLLILSILACASARADFVIDNTTYTVDTLVHRQVGPGMVNTIVRIPGYPLNVYVLEVDLNNPNNRVETTIGYNTVGRTEALANAYTRNRTATKRPVAGCNGNFWVVTGNGAPWSHLQQARKGLHREAVGQKGNRASGIHHQETSRKTYLRQQLF